MAESEQFDLIVLGGGPGGYVAAIRAAQLGMKVACVEKENALGGACLRVGCIPSKALLDSSELYVQMRDHAEKHGFDMADLRVDVARMLRRKDEVVVGLTKGLEGLFRKNKITWVRGFGRLAGTDRVEVDVDGNLTQTLQSRNILLATGSVPAELPFLKFDNERVIDSTGALSIPHVPNHLAVVGGGVIGLELGSVWLRLGARVTILEATSSILPEMDRELARHADRILRKQGFDIRTSARVVNGVRHGDRVIISMEGAEPIEADYVLVSVGRRACTQGMGFEENGISIERDLIKVDGRYHTGVENIYAIGDAIGGRMLAHKAEEEGIAAVEFIAGNHGHVNYDTVANIVYTWPEIASVGASEEELQARGIGYKAGRFPWIANGRARAMGESDGFVKLLADAVTDRVLGVHILGPRASDLIAEAALAIQLNGTAEDVARTVHAHPSLPEGLKEAALAANRRALHI